MQENKENPRNTTKEKIVTATLVTGLFLGGCQAKVEQVYSDDSVNIDSTEELFNFAEGYDKEGKYIEVSEEDEKVKIVDGPAIIKPNPNNNDIIVIYPGQAYLLEEDAVLWRYDGESEEKVIQGLEAQTKYFDGEITRITGEEKESFRFAEGYNSEGKVVEDEIIEGPAIIKKSSASDDIIVVYPGQSCRVINSRVWKYDADSDDKMVEGLKAQTQFFDGEIEVIKEEE